MFPYIHASDVHLGPLTLHPFGILVATGVILGTNITLWRAKKRGIDLGLLNSFITWMLAGGFLGGHILDTIFYHPKEVFERPLSLILLWEGLSSFGGFAGAVIGAYLWKYFDWAKPEGRGKKTWSGFLLGGLLCAVLLGAFGFLRVPEPRDYVFKFLIDRGQPERVASVGAFAALGFVLGGGLGALLFSVKFRPTPKPFFPLADVIMSVFPIAWIFGRGGCATVHDHPGALTTRESFFGVGYPSHLPKSTKAVELLYGEIHRYDLGLLEWFFTVALSFLLVLTWRKRLPTGTYIAVVCLSYAPVRFAMDALRIREGDSADPRYGSLTPAQWSCVALFLLGVGAVWLIRRNKARGVDPINEVLQIVPSEGGETEAYPSSSRDMI